MTAITFKSDKANVDDLSFTTTHGVDITKPIVAAVTEREILLHNCGKRQALLMGPVCHVKRKTTPCYVGCSPRAGIKSEMLADMLRTIGICSVYDRSEGKLSSDTIQDLSCHSWITFMKNHIDGK